MGWRRPLVLLVTAAALSVATTLPWLASMLLTDIFAGLAVLALYLLTLRATTLARWERWALIALIAFSAATHTATLAVLLALLAAGLVVALVRRGIVPFTGLARGAFALALSVALLLAANYRGRRPARLDAGRRRDPVRPHAAGRHRRALSRRTLPRPAPAEALRPPRRAPRRRRRVLLGLGPVRRARPLRGPGRRDAHRRARKPHRLSRAQLKAALAGDRRSSSCASPPATACTPTSGTPTGRRDDSRRSAARR